MARKSAGLLMYKLIKGNLSVFLVHPGGPFWKGKDIGSWMIPKGEVEDGESYLETAKRELEEETGVKALVSDKEYIDLGEIKQKGCKVVRIFAFRGDFSGFFMKQSFVEIEWPYKSGKKIKVPEVDKARFFEIKEAREKIFPSQKEFLERLKRKISLSP